MVLHVLRRVLRHVLSRASVLDCSKGAVLGMWRGAWRRRRGMSRGDRPAARPCGVGRDGARWEGVELMLRRR